MKCKLNPNIESLSGKNGNVLFRTYRKPNGKTETRAYLLPRRRDGKFGYERKAALTQGEIAARDKFKQISARVKDIPMDEKLAYHAQWKKANYKFNGKKYATLRGYIIARLYAEDKDGANS